MHDLLPFLVVGVASGAVYGLAGVGLVLTYKTSGIFNFAHGAIATVAAVCFYALHVQLGLSTPLALVAALVVAGLGLGLGFELLARRLVSAPLALRVAATVGIMLVVIAAVTLLYGSTARAYPQFLPTSTFRFLGAYVGWNQLIVVVVSLVATAALYVFFRIARTGKAMRAVVDDPDLLDLAGTSPIRVRRWAWVIGSLFAAASGLLLAPSIQLSASGLTLLVVQAFGAAAIGAFSSLPGTWAGGIGIGVVASLVTKYVSSTSILGGLSPSLPFIVLFAVILVSPRRRNGSFGQQLRRQVTSVRRAPAALQMGMAVVTVAILASAPAFAGFHLAEWTGALADVLLLLSLGLLVRTSGQVCLAQVSFAAVGAVAFSKLAGGPHLPWLLALVLAGLVAVPLGALLAIPAIRLSGLYLALGTFGFGVLLQDMFYNSNVMFGTSDLGLRMPAPDLRWLGLGSTEGLYYTVLVLTVVGAAGIVVLTRARLGRLLRALADAPVALETGGTNVTATRTLVFCLSAFLAAIAGALAGTSLTIATGSSYDPLTSLSLLALVLMVPAGEPWYAVVGGLGLGLIPAYLPATTTTNVLEIVFGASALLAAVGVGFRLPDEWHELLERLSDGLRRPLGRRAPSAPPVSPALTAAAPALLARAASSPVDAPSPPALAVEDLTVRFGGLVAVQNLSLSVPRSSITGLIGPNGSGKTTTFNACSGLVRPNQGRVLLHGVDITRLGPARRARHGLGRTFQLMQLYSSLTVLDSVSLGREAAKAGDHVFSQFAASPPERAAARRAALAALELCGIDHLAARTVASLSTGQQRLVELARALAGPFDVILLDEPSSGLDRAETRRFGEILRAAVGELGLSLLLVEHDMSLVLDVCEDVFVLNFGSLLFHGPPTDLERSAAVRAAYLGQVGSDEPEPRTRSGNGVTS
jgi:ABC-type branched-subunit amino acid transport system ATPase component/branched-subunit amino acid ABC-type transport system permease component